MVNLECGYSGLNDDSLPLRASIRVPGLGEIKVYGDLLDGIVFTRTRPVKRTKYDKEVAEKDTAKGRAEKAWGMTTPAGDSKRV